MPFLAATLKAARTEPARAESTSVYSYILQWVIGDGLRDISRLMIFCAPIVRPTAHTETTIGEKEPIRALGVARCGKQITDFRLITGARAHAGFCPMF